MGEKGKKILENLLYPELSYKIVGVLSDVYNELGYGHPEKTYQKAIAVKLKNSSLQFAEQLYAPVLIDGVVIGKNFFDF